MEAFKDKDVMATYIQIKWDMYDKVKMRVKTLGGDINDFPIEIGLS